MKKKAFDITDIPEAIQVKYCIDTNKWGILITQPFYSFIPFKRIEGVFNEGDCILLRCDVVGFRLWFGDEMPSIIIYSAL